MSALRSIVLPSVVSTPLWLWVLPIQFRGLEALKEFPPEKADWIFGFVLTLVGLLLIGLPSAAFVGSHSMSFLLKSAVLTAIGATGGAIVAMLYVALLLSQEWSFEMIKILPAISSFGLLPGAIVALVWIVFNSRTLSNLARDSENA